MQDQSNNVSSVEYANFGIRLVAFLIDRVFLGVIFAVVSLACSPLFSSSGDGIWVAMLVIFLGAILIPPLYFGIFESSVWQASPGKKLLGLKVVDMNGVRLSFWRAFARTLAGIVTGLIPFAIGYLMAAFTQRKQAVHDMIASCLVVPAENPPGVVPPDNSEGSSVGVIVAVCMVFAVIAIAIIGILAAIAIPIYQEYTLRAKVTAAAFTAKRVTGDITTFYQANQRLPVTVEELKFSLSGENPNTISSLKITPSTGRLILTLKGDPQLEGKQLLFTPVNLDDPMTLWQCSSDDLTAKLLPTMCR